MEGIGLINKVSKNNIRWDGPGSDVRRRREEKLNRKKLERETNIKNSQAPSGNNAEEEKDDLLNIDPEMKKHYLQAI